MIGERSRLSDCEEPVIVGFSAAGYSPSLDSFNDGSAHAAKPSVLFALARPRPAPANSSARAVARSTRRPLPRDSSHAFASPTVSWVKSTSAHVRPGRTTARCSRRSGSSVVTSTTTRSPSPSNPLYSISSRDSPCPATARASAASSSPASSSTTSRQRCSPPQPPPRLEPQQRAEQVTRLPAKERVGIGYEIGVAPAAPLARHSPQRVGLPRPRVAVPQQQPAWSRSG